MRNSFPLAPSKQALYFFRRRGCSLHDLRCGTTYFIKWITIIFIPNNHISITHFVAMWAIITLHKVLFKWQHYLANSKQTLGLHLGNTPAMYTYIISQSHVEFFFRVPLSLISIMNSCTRQCAGHFLAPTLDILPQIYQHELLHSALQLRLSWEHCPTTTIGSGQSGNTMALIQLSVTLADRACEKVLSKIRRRLLDSCRTMKS